MLEIKIMFKKSGIQAHKYEVMAFIPNVVFSEKR
jgi:hypothetical protein